MEGTGDMLITWWTEGDTCLGDYLVVSFIVFLGIVKHNNSFILTKTDS